MAREYFLQAIENPSAQESGYGALGLIDYIEEDYESSIYWLHKVI